jgi:hypothetical protein
MLDRLFDFITDILELFQFWVVIDEYERGVVKTLGKRVLMSLMNSRSQRRTGKLSL